MRNYNKKENTDTQKKISLLHRSNRPPRINNHQHIELLVGKLAKLDPLPRGDSPLVHVKVEHANLAMEPAVPGVATEPRRAGVAHP